MKTKDKQRLVCSKSSKTRKEEVEGWQGLQIQPAFSCRQEYDIKAPNK